MGTMLNCKKATRLLLEAEERKLTPSELEALDFHLQRCLSCQNYKVQMGFLRRASQLYARYGADPAVD